jgi:hypothetical protein
LIAFSLPALDPETVSEQRAKGGAPADLSTKLTFEVVKEPVLRLLDDNEGPPKRNTRRTSFSLQ